MPKKKPAKKRVEEVIEEEEDEVTCPVCGKSVGMSVPSCPFCGAEFEEEAVEEVEVQAEARPQAKEAPVAKAEEAVGEDEMAECPVCGTMVSLSVPSCPSCGAEFEEEEIEEVVEVEEAPVRAPPSKAPPAKAKPAKVVAEDEEVLVEEEPVRELGGSPSSIVDLRVVGISLILLGIIGSQISFMIDWYWTWVPPIEDNMALFVAIPGVIVVAGLIIFMLIKRSAPGGRKKIPAMVPSLALSTFLFGILALILVMLWNPVNSALEDSSVGMGMAFVAILVIGVLAVFMGNRMAAPRSAC